MAFTKAQQTAIAAAVAEQVASRAASEAHAAEMAKPVTAMSMRESLSSMLGGFELPSGKRMIISLVAGVVLAGIAGFVGAQLVVTMTAYAATLTNSAFLLFMIQFVGYALAFIAAAMLGGKLQAAILDGGVDRGFTAAKSWVGGLFSRSNDAIKTVAS